MPNHCMNTLEIEGPPARLRGLLDRWRDLAHEHNPREGIDRDNGYGLTFEAMVPTPSHVLPGRTGTCASGRREDGTIVPVPHREGPDGKRYADETGLRDVASRHYGTRADGTVVFEEEMTHVGLISWYDWRVGKGWGTKWDAYSVAVDVTGLEAGGLRIDFDTAWSPPVPVVLALQERHSDLTIRLHAEEPGMGYQLDVHADGELVETELDTSDAFEALDEEAA